MSVLLADLGELQLNWRFPSKNGQQRLELVALTRHLDHFTLEVFKRTSGDKNLIAFSQIDLNDGFLLGSALKDPIYLRTAKRSRFDVATGFPGCLLYTSPSPRDMRRSRMPSSA